MKEKKLYKIAFMGDKDCGCDIISTLKSWGGSNYYSRSGSDPEYVYFINDLGTIDLIHNSEMLSEEMKNFYFIFWHDYNIECQLKVGESFNYKGQDYNVDSILFDANNRCIVYKLKAFGIDVEYITNNELTPTEECQTEEENIAIIPHITRGREVIKILESLGGVNADGHKGNLPIEWESAYYIYGDCTIQFARIDFLEKLNYKIYTLEEYEQRKL